MISHLAMRSRRKSADSYQYSPPPEIISAHHECLAQTPPTLAWRAREICGDAGIRSLRQRNAAAVGRDPGGLRSADPGYWCGPGGGECAQSPPALQCMKQYVPRRPHRATTVFTRCNVNIEDSLQWCVTRRCAHVMAARRSAGVLSSPSLSVDPVRLRPLPPGVIFALQAWFGGWPPRANTP